jgi:riboflavin kinase / FMN adenylyltransferase
MQLKGKVVKGLGIGTKLGYPTANLDCESVDQGVYAACVKVNRQTYGAIAVIGVRDKLVEIMLLDFDGDLYGKELEVDLFNRVSDIARFDNEEDLIKKIKDDIEKVLCLLE